MKIYVANICSQRYDAPSKCSFEIDDAKLLTVATGFVKGVLDVDDVEDVCYWRDDASYSNAIDDDVVYQFCNDLAYGAKDVRLTKLVTKRLRDLYNGRRVVVESDEEVYGMSLVSIDEARAAADSAWNGGWDTY